TESLILALKDTLPARHHSMIPINEEAIKLGMSKV
ncbi:MAG TPA: 2-oxoacid:ferredoxin oxidoreductase subunit gamma, partial [bacterium]|nr:2-oxoacid:ferredoxin oxidoreductase subunit gamma [bacterium]